MSIKPCDQDVFDNGQSVCLVDIPKETAENICRSLSAATGCKIDWHYIGGRVHIKALAAPVVERQEPVALSQQVAAKYTKLHEIAVDAALSATMRYSYMPKDKDDNWKPHSWVIAAMDKAVQFYAEQPEPVAVVNLRNFANAMIDIALEGADADGGHIQELAIKHGLLMPEQRTERCGDTCSCAEYADFPVECFRKELNQ